MDRANASSAGITRQPFGATPEGAAVDLFTLTNGNGLELQVISYGAIVTALRVPDRRGVFADVVLGFDRLEPYLARHPYFGAVVGRYANRIGNARFALDGRTFNLGANDGANHLHGGLKGFDRYVWVASSGADANRIVFTRTSADGEEGYPGNMELRVAYSLTGSNSVVIEYEATTDRATPINVTQHTYFNLAGHAAGDVLGHELRLNADRYTPVDRTLIPTGELAPVEGTPLDFRTATLIGGRIESPVEQMQFGRGYDHNWVVNHTAPGQLTPAAWVHEPASGRSLEVATTEPGVQLYTGNFLDGTLRGKDGARYQRRAGLCLETQHYPDSPNKPQFPTTILRAGQTFRSVTTWTFSA